MFDACHRCSFSIRNVFLYLTINVTRRGWCQLNDAHRHADDDDWFHTSDFSSFRSKQTQLNQRDSPSNISLFFSALTTKYSRRKRAERESGERKRKRESERSVHRTQVKRERWRENVCNFLVRLFSLSLALSRAFLFPSPDFFLYK